MNFKFDWNCVSAGAPYVTISSLGLAFNSPSINMLGCPENVVVGFDEKNMAIGIRKAEESETAKSYKFKSRIKNGWVRIGCKEFVKYLSELSGNVFSPAVRYIAKYDSDKEILYIIIHDKDNAKEVDG
ncbi:MAG: hypothetical protein LUB59_05960 [Candidatus Gastranaerophilales bacterium]|nr:hypothetical protein [Candidatus Gastranaerophilales bacterium]